MVYLRERDVSFGGLPGSGALRVIFCKVQTGVTHQYHQFSPNLAQSDLITYIATWQTFFCRVSVSS